jgi:hypothetical protein
MTYRLIAALPFAALTLVVGCSSTPGCSDSKTVALVLKGFGQHLDELLRADKVPQTLVDQFRPSLQVALNTITMTATDDKIKKNSCAADLEVKMPPDAVTVLSDERLSRVALGKSPSELPFKLSKGTASIELKYTAQLTDDGKNVVVEMKGHSPLANVLSRLASYGAMDPSARSLSLPPMARMCDDPVAKQQLLELMEDALADLAKNKRVDQVAVRDYRNRVTFAFEDVKTVDVSADLSDVHCTARLKATLPDDGANLFHMAKKEDPRLLAVAILSAQRQDETELRLLKGLLDSEVGIEGQTLSQGIEYRSSVTQDKEQVEMYVQGHRPLLEVIVATAALTKTTGNPPRH